MRRLFLIALAALASALALTACTSEKPSSSADAGIEALDAAEPVADSGVAEPDAGEQADSGPPLADAGSDAGTPGPCEGNQLFEIGTGIHDITGPAAGLGMMGYSMVGQKTAGIHTRLWSRAFVISSPCNGKRIVFVSADLLAVFQAVQQQVVERLRTRYGDLYTEENVFLSATHTHSGPGGYSHYTTYDLSILGFNQQCFENIVDGIYRSIVAAHESLTPGRIRVASGDLLGASINRSPTAYQNDPEEERARYPYDTDKTMTVLRLESASGEERGLISWFGVHPTSMGNDNHLISADNKGYASYWAERAKGTDYAAPRPGFIAAFAQASAGDSSPNIFGGTDGGGPDDFASTEIAGRKQLDKALELYEAADQPLVGPVDFRHVFTKMDEVQLEPETTGGAPRKTCVAAYGVSMIAGAEDGPGYGKEGATCEEIGAFWSGLTCTPDRTECQAEKPIVFSAGDRRPYPWSPEVLPFHLVRIGNLALVGLPLEVTTMSSRRIRETAMSRLSGAGIDRLIVSGPVNAYASYLTTREEYATQNYEGASTHFGPWQLAAVQLQVDKLAGAMAGGTTLEPGPAPRDLRNAVISFQVGVLYDDKYLTVDFGDVVEDVEPLYQRGEVARAVFWGAHPANNLRTGDTFLRVERKEGDDWVTVARDWDWETRYLWRRHNCVPTFGCSHVTVEWHIPADAEPGTYRLRCFGDWKSGISGQLSPYEGTSSEFEVR